MAQRARCMEMQNTKGYLAKMYELMHKAKIPTREWSQDTFCLVRKSERADSELQQGDQIVNCGIEGIPQMHWSWLPELVLGSPGRTIYMLVRRSEGKEEWVKQKAHSTVYGGVLGVQLTISTPQDSLRRIQPSSSVLMRPDPNVLRLQAVVERFQKWHMEPVQSVQPDTHVISYHRLPSPLPDDSTQSDILPLKAILASTNSSQ